jgi:hypothetical protein
MTSLTDLFELVLEEHRLHPQYRDLCNVSYYSSARSLINELYGRMGDPNGNFVRDFQGHGFHARLFELACYAYLESAQFTIDRSFEWPDFLARGPCDIAVEAVTANPADDQPRDISLARMARLSQEQIMGKVITDFPKRMGSSLRRKLAKRYHEAAHVSGKPVVLMIAPCFEAGAGFYTDDAFLYGLYGPPNSEPVWQGRPAFFWQDRARSISAVLYCNAFTVSRFFRLAASMSPRLDIVSIRTGVCREAHDDSQYAQRSFEFRVGDPGTPTESWSEGVTIFHNPFAAIPLPDNVLPASCVTAVREGYVSREIHGFHPCVSFMVTHVPKAAHPDDADSARVS